MLGFEILIYRADRVSNPLDIWPEEDALLVSWLVGGFDGLVWIDDLVKGGKATALGGNGYPLRYTALAQHLLPKIAGGIPSRTGGPILGEDYFLPAGWIGDPSIKQNLAECPPDQLLLINAWDQS